MSSNDEIIKRIKKELRAACNVKTAIKIRVTETNDEPNIKGYKAVKRKWKWKNSSYTASTRRIEVGLGSAILLPYVIGNEQLQKELLALYDSNNL